MILDGANSQKLSRTSRRFYRFTKTFVYRTIRIAPTAHSPSRWRNGHDNENFQFSILHRIHVGRVARCYRNHRYSRRLCCNRIQRHSGARAHYARHEQPASNSDCHTDLFERQRCRLLFAEHELDDITSSKVSLQLEDLSVAFRQARSVRE